MTDAHGYVALESYLQYAGYSILQEASWSLA